MTLEVYEAGGNASHTRIRLGQADFVGQGGEAAVYAKGNRAYKIYTDPGRSLPGAKIAELAVLSEPCYIRPEALLLDRANRPVGYSMRRVQGGTPLCQIFTRAFRDRKGLTPEKVLELVRQFREGVARVHQGRILVVDLNEMNFLLDQRLREILFIDVDSYQTPGFPATALMESVRDRHSSRFSEGTDWFAFGIVSFQMFIGIHPYKGKHPSLNTLDARMQANVSVLHPEVNVPRVCLPFSVIPPAYLSWYRALFEHGKRLPPPTDLREQLVLVVAASAGAVGNGPLQLIELCRFASDVVTPFVIRNTFSALTRDGLSGSVGPAGGVPSPVGTPLIPPVGGPGTPDGGPAGAEIGYSPRERRPIAACVDAGRLVLFDLQQSRPLTTAIAADAVTSCDGRLLAQHGAVLHQVELLELPAGIQAALTPVGNLLPNAARLFEGVAIQNLLGAWHAVLSPRAGTGYTVALPELAGYQVVNARYENQVLLVVGARAGQFDRFCFRFDPEFRHRDVRRDADVPNPELNFTVLDSGVVLLLNEQDELEMFSHRVGASDRQTLTDPALTGAKLFHRGAQLLLARGGTLFAASLRS